MPVRNAAATVDAAVASIRAQTFSDWELLAIDDGSVDGTREVLQSAARRDPRIRVSSGPQRGIVAALNEGIARAEGEFVARMDADDECHPDRLTEQVAFLRDPGHRAIGLVSCLVEFGGDRRAAEGYARHVDWINSLITPAAIRLNRFVESPFAHPSVMFRRALIAQQGGYREGGFPEDYELWLRWLGAGVDMAKVPRVLLRWNDARARLSRTDPRYDPEAFFRVKAPWIALELTSGLLAPPGPGGSRVSERSLWIWGAGRPTRRRAAWLEQAGLRIAGYVDVDARKLTPALGGGGVPVVAPRDLPAPEQAVVLGFVSSRGARELIRDALRARGGVEGRDFLMCA